MDLLEAKFNNIQNAHHPWEHARVDVVFTLLKKHLGEKLFGEIIIADIGCGDVFLIKQLSEKLPLSIFIAIDTAFSAEMLNDYKTRFQSKNIYVFNSMNEVENIIKKAIDLVLLLDVIEHVENEINFLKEINTFLKINTATTFIITVPAFQCLFIMRDTFLKHYRRYNNRTLTKVIVQAGLQPLEKGYFFFSLLPIRAIQKILEIFHKPHLESITGIGNWNENPFKDSLFKIILKTDFLITNTFKKFGINMPGLSNYLICKKSV